MNWWLALAGMAMITGAILIPTIGEEIFVIPLGLLMIAWGLGGDKLLKEIF